MTPLDDAALAELEALCAATAAEPIFDDGGLVLRPPIDTVLARAARNALPGLLAEVRRLRRMDADGLAFVQRLQDERDKAVAAVTRLKADIEERKVNWQQEWQRAVAAEARVAELEAALKQCACSACPYEDDGACKPGCRCGAAVAVAALAQPKPGDL